MPPRLSKRQQREHAELQHLVASAAANTGLGEDAEHASSGEDDEVEQDDDAATAAIAKSGGLGRATAGFAALDLGRSDDDQDEHDIDDDDEQDEPSTTIAASTTKKSKNKKKKKKTQSSSTATPNTTGVNDTADAAGSATPTTSTSTPNKASASSKKKKNAKSVTGTPRGDSDDLDEIDRALAELASKGGPSLASIQAQQQSSHLDRRFETIKGAFSFDTKLLDGDAELRKFFGSKIASPICEQNQIQHTATAPRSQHHARFANNPHHSTSIKRTASYLANPEAGWLPAAGILKLENYDGPEAKNDRSGDWWTYVHTPEYKIAQMGFLEGGAPHTTHSYRTGFVFTNKPCFSPVVLQQADGNRLYSILQSQPYHIDTHLQLAEMLNQQADLTGSSQHLARALYAMSAPLPPSFTSGSFRLSYNRIENRAFFIAVARNVAIQTKRGTWRTATEWAKIALGCSGGMDPMGMLCFLDFLAPKSGQNDWFLSLLDELPNVYPNQPECQVDLYPGLAYAKALCLRQLHPKETSSDSVATKALTSAILRFPAVVPLLLSTLGGNVPPALISHSRAQVSGSYTTDPSYLTSLLSSLYAHRSSPLWKDPSLLSWLTSTASSIVTSLNDSSNSDVIFGEKAWSSQHAWKPNQAPEGIIRALYLDDVPSLRPYLPPSITSNGEAMYSYDPLPPQGPNVTYYSDDYFEVLHSTSVGKRIRQQNASRAQAQRGGAAARGFAAQLAALLGVGQAGGAIDMNDDLRRELMDELAMLQAGGEGGQGGFPGGFPGFGGDTDEETE
ncbi:BQ2448_3316 [Microbotryum intermedium]|uniref:BQ2448_3316 protein n=1 Tax=Microbotryum intermedium TaxID=269621 RepID=A0A238FFA4_9BASI|nr:BQ2448_3316 [Microbotryum intermedium]